MNLDNALIASPKVQPRHLDRLAVVYIRQSTAKQVAEHRESADLQYQLRHRAVALGWADARILVIDDDQGVSGQSVENRLGFQRLLAEISLDHVGMILGREMSRLARSNKDWHQLLELCALFQILLGDADGVYDPADFNDRLLLGLKGTMSEAELHILKSRMHAGKINKARRGELFGCVPVGYVRTDAGGIALDPDEQARSVVRLIFEKFADLGSISKVHAYFVAHDIRIGLRIYKGPDKGKLEWHKARRRTIVGVLRHPIYAGAYVYGRNPVVRKINGRQPKQARRTASPQECILLKDRVPAYISWEQYEANRRRVSENGLYRPGKSSPGTSPTLLNGLVVCGRCGKAMSVRNGRITALPRYVCDWAKYEYGEPLCQGLRARAVDQLIETLVLQAVQPAALELSLRAAEQMERDRDRLHAQWRQKIERANYETGRARRQYDAVDPENRLVCRELERQWEAKLTEQRQLNEAYARFQNEQPRHLTAQDREQIRALAADVPALWQATTTASGDRRAVVRQLIEQVVITRRGTTELIDVVIKWRGVPESHHVVHQGTRRYDQLADFERLKVRIAELRIQGLTATQTAEVLDKEGFRTPRGGPYSCHRVRLASNYLKQTNSLPGMRAEDLPQKNEWWIRELASDLGMDMAMMRHWCRVGLIQSRKLPGGNGRIIVWADRSEVRRLRRLHAYSQKHPNEPVPPELSKPKCRPTTRKNRRSTSQ